MEKPVRTLTQPHVMAGEEHDARQRGHPTEFLLSPPTCTQGALPKADEPVCWTTLRMGSLGFISPLRKGGAAATRLQPCSKHASISPSQQVGSQDGAGLG